ncbi:bacillithiol biosynthesis deacetylase BshB1 [bacterium]|nr:bacillithiol biosynthesis deacetylase BshB1 [bacterium]
MVFDALAIGAHADDVELGCGGTLINLTDKGYLVAIADLTEALLATRGDAETRVKENTVAAEIMGVRERFQLGFKEGSIATGANNLIELTSLIRKTKPYILFAPYWEDRHPDHVDASKLIQSAAFWSGIAKFGDNQPPHRPHRIFYYFTHWEGPVSLSVDISAAFDRKLKAIRSYRSQFSPHLGNERMTYISRPEFLEKLISRARYFGSKTGVEYGEPFFLRDMNRIEDAMAWAGEQGVIG